MGSSIVERTLGVNKIYTEQYLKETILLTKSITVKCNKEAELYNQYVRDILKQPVDQSDKSTWRYYRHLAALYHSVDRPVTIISLDNGQEVTLDQSTIELHKFTRAELLKYDYYYKELIDRYPDQELFIKSLISTSSRLNAKAISELEDFTIVTYNDTLVEEQETNLISELQVRINNYKNTKLLTTYSLMDSYYLASLFHILYNFIVTTLIALRLKNAKTQLAHSYHILNYLASHHGLDKYYNYLTKNQVLFLYRNLLYLNNHSGRNHIFSTLIQKLFTDNKVSITNYIMKQSNSTTDEGYMEYRFNQTPLNKTPLVYDTRDFSLEELRDREVTIVPNNDKEYKFHQTEIDCKHKNSLYSMLLTKDLEITLTDNSNDVKYKLLPTITDYWAHLLNMKQLNYIATVVDPITNVSYSLHTEDLFKLFVIALYKYNDIDLIEFPVYTSTRVYKTNLPTLKELYSVFYKKTYTLTKTCEQVHFSVPRYRYCTTSYAFNELITDLYTFNLGVWLLQANTGDKENNAQLDLFVENLHTRSEYRFNNETVGQFLKRIGLEYILTYNQETLYDIVINTLNAATYNKLGDIGKNKYTQEALVEVFKRFTSYSVQIIDRYISSESILLLQRSPSYSVHMDSSKNCYTIPNSEYLDVYSSKKTTERVSEADKVTHTNSYTTTSQFNPTETVVQDASIEFYSIVNLPAPYPIDVESGVTLPDQDHLLFLCFNQ